MLCVRQIINQRYQLQQKLGERPARQTWLALDATTDSSVVIKFLAFGGQMQWSDLKLFEREAQILRELKHLRIPQYRDYFRIDEDTLWFAIVEQHIPGESLQNLLDRGKRFSESEVKNIALELLEILSYLHQLNPPVLHRDLKPSNIILGKNKKIYLIDFGSIQDNAATQGASFTVVGTYGYTPIEQFGGRAVAASDLYALGATLIHLLTRTPPADLLQEDLQLQFQEKVEVSRDLASWLSKMSAPTLKERFHSVAQAQQALKLLLDKDNSSQHQPKQEIQRWQKIQEQEDYLVSNKNFPIVFNRGKDPLLELEQSFTTKSNNKHHDIKTSPTTSEQQRNEKLFNLGLFSLFLTLMMIGIFHQVSIWTAEKILQKCAGKEKCEGRVETLEKLSKARQGLGKYNLNSTNLESANLQSANLHSANLQSTNLESANLQSANLYSANLQSANLYFANLEFANLQSTNLESANLESANLQSTNLESANLQSANLESTNLQSANLYFANLESANFRDADLESANLQSAKLESANLYSAKLESANLESAYLRFANLQSANLYSANLESADLWSVNLMYANLKSPNLRNANLGHANLVYVNLMYANLQSANLQSANLENTNLIGASHLTNSQIKKSCNWEKAVYKGMDEKNSTWIVDEAANREYIQQLKQDKASDPETPVDCSQWE